MASGPSGGLNSIISKAKEFVASLNLSGGGTAVGLSIGTSSIKLVELKKTGKVWKLLHFGIVQLPEDAVVNREIINAVAVIDSIKTLVNQMKLKSKRVCTSLSGTSLIIKRMNLEVPKLSDLQEQVFWEAEQYLPFEVTEVIMDYQMLSRTKDHKTDVLLVAAKKTVVESYMECVTGAGLVPKMVDVDFFSIQNVFESNYPNNPSEAVMLVDIGASSTKMVIVHQGIPVFTKDTSFGGRNATAEIQGKLNVSFQDAEALKVGGANGGMPQEVSEILNINCENISTEIKRAIDFYTASSSGAPVAFILLAGGGAKVPNLSKVVEDQIGVPVQLMNPFNAIAYDPSVFTPEYVAAIAPIAVVPIGLALRAGEPK